ncbi:unnamed protein product [Absidia cylindrospora]
MVLELGDSCIVRCRTSDLICELDFKTKGFFSGQYNSVVGKIKTESTNKVLYEILGQWSGQIYIKAPSKTAPKSTLFNASAAFIAPKRVRMESKQDPLESRRLWSQLTSAIKSNNMDEATKQKTAIEDEQRRKTKERNDAGMDWVPRYFTRADDSGGDEQPFVFKLHSTDNHDELETKLKSEISMEEQSFHHHMSTPATITTNPMTVTL